MKQTAVEWLWRWQMDNEFASFKEGVDAYQQAKAMEKKIIINSYCEGFKISGEGWNGEYGIEDFNNLSEEIKAEDYYNKTYNK
jgi:hypothetical protein